MMGKLEGKVALVTGAASGLGRAAVVKLLAEGAFVVAGDINESGVQELAGERCAAQRCDVTSEEQQEALADLAVAQFGRLDIAVANAGVGHLAPVVGQTVQDWRRIIDLCLTGTYITVQVAAKRMAESGGGAIVLMSSLNSMQPANGMTAYCSAKAGVSMLAQTAALELGALGIRCNAIAPGLVHTPATAPLWGLPGLIDDFTENTPLGRLTSAEDVAELIAFLVSPAAESITGTVQLIDSGARLKRSADLVAAIGRIGAS
jgi:NAD(P)-dependent dehydrogenase (short-subunit alcohol dehydrogenase family)